MQNKDWTGNRKSIYTTLGASNHTDKERENNDYYATEPKAAELLLEVEEFAPDIWECACGEGHLSKVFETHGYNVKSTDLVYRGYGLSKPFDFLTDAVPNSWNGSIITNPPYKYGYEFVEKALGTVTEGNKVAMFLKIQFLEGKKRIKLFDVTPPHKQYMCPAPDCSVLKMENLKK